MLKSPKIYDPYDPPRPLSVADAEDRFDQIVPHRQVAKRIINHLEQRILETLMRTDRENAYCIERTPDESYVCKRVPILGVFSRLERMAALVTASGSEKLIINIIPYHQGTYNSIRSAVKEFDREFKSVVYTHLIPPREKK